MPGTWGIVLAGGQGRRLARLTGGVPKQFWRAGNEESLLERTLGRLAPLAPASRTIVVVDASHERFIRTASLSGPRVLYQPCDRGTAAGVLLAILPVLDADRRAVVVLTPADHGVADAERFLADVRHAIGRIRRGGAGIVIFGVEPTNGAIDYGWIQPGRPTRHSHTRPVAGFVEKPDAPEAARLFRTGAVWNTMVLVAHVETLGRLIAARVPALHRSVSRAWTAGRVQDLDRAYAGLTSRDFSRDVIAGSPGLEVSVWPASIGWSDLGTPDRMSAWLTASRPATATTSAA